MTTPREYQDEVPATWCCDCCEEGADGRHEIYTCSHPGCDADSVYGICLGCTYECADCRRDFCRQHVVSEPVKPGQAIHRCEACDAKRKLPAAA